MNYQKNIQKKLTSLRKAYDTLKIKNPNHELLKYAGPYIPINGIYFKKGFIENYGTNEGDGECYDNYKKDLEHALTN